MNISTFRQQYITTIPARGNRLLALAVGLASLIFFTADHASAQYSVTGTTAGGGEIIVGSGTLGALSTITTPALSAGGFDHVTLTIGGIATASGVDTIAFTTSNNTLVNNATVIGADNALSGGAGFNAVSFTGAGVLSGESVTNNGTVTGGVGARSSGGSTATAGGGGAGISFTGNSITGVSVNNTGNATGGSGNAASGGSVENDGGAGGNGINFSGTGSSINNVVVINSGHVTGGVGGSAMDALAFSGNGGHAIGFSSMGDLTNVTVTNTGVLTGGDSGPAGAADISISDFSGNGLEFSSQAGIHNITVNNSGLTVGGNGGASNNPAFSTGGNGGSGIEFDAQSDITGVTLANSGTAAGGRGGTANGSNGSAGNAGDGISMTGTGNINGVSVTNTGSILGGQGTTDVGGFIGGFGGFGISIISPFGTIGNTTIVNYGNIAGGNGGGGQATSGGPGSAGIYVDSGNGVINGVTVRNSGNVAGGSGGDSSGAPASSGGSGGSGIAFGGFTSPLSNITINNSGNVTGGNGGNASAGSVVTGGASSQGISIDSLSGPVSNVTVINSGRIAAGTGGSASGGTISNAGGQASSGVVIAASGALTNATLLNTGSIFGGNGGDGSTGMGGNGGKGVSINGSAASSGIVVNNYGFIAGGNGGPGATQGQAGYGVLANAAGVTINNWGTISAGSGLATVQKSGFPAAAIEIQGNNNVVNLYGHSSVFGTIEAKNGTVNNVLNLDFTGVSVAELLSLKAQLAAQGWTPGGEFTGTFTLRGVTYYIDPLVLNIGGISSYQLQGLTANQQAVGASLDSLLVNPVAGAPITNLFNAIDASGNVPAALEALSPQKYEAYGALAISEATAMVQSVDDRLNNLRDGSESIDTTGVGGSNDKTTAGYGKDSDGKDAKNVVTSTPEQHRWGFFATGDGLFSRRGNRDGDLAGFRANTAGTVAGVDAKIGDHFVAGALFAYDNANAKLGGDGSQAYIDSYTGGLYGAWHQDGFYANSLLAYTYNHYDSQRNIIFPGFSSTANASTHGNQYTANLDGGYDWHLTDRVTLGPIVGLQYVHLDVQGFNETGAGAADLAIGNQRVNSLQSRIGGQVNYHLASSGNTSFAAELHAAWQHEYLDDSHAIDASFIGDGLAPFSVQTSSPLRDAGVVGVSLNATFHDRLTLFAGSEIMMWRTNSYDLTISAGGRISF